MQYVHSHSLEITQMLKSGYLSDQQKLNRLTKYFNEITLMERCDMSENIGGP